MKVSEEQATVFRVGNRRFFTKRAAFRRAAVISLMEDIGADAACECENAEWDTGYPGSTCAMHLLETAAVTARARDLMKATHRE